MTLASTGHVPLIMANLGPNVTDSIRYLAFGLGIIMLALAAVWLIAHVVGLLLAGYEPPPLQHPATADAMSELEPVPIAAIAAAVAIVLDRPHRIITLHAEPRGRAPWTQEGRHRHFASHKLR